MDIAFIIIAGIVVLVILVWFFFVNSKDRKNLEQKLNRNYPVHEKHKETSDPENMKAD